jgi:hypothetical protein
MEIKFNTKIDPVAPPSGTPVKPREVKEAKDGAAFDHAQALDQAVRAAGDSRSEMVEMGKKLASSINYPPPELINRIANLLAMNVKETGKAD